MSGGDGWVRSSGDVAALLVDLRNQHLCEDSRVCRCIRADAIVAIRVLRGDLADLRAAVLRALNLIHASDRWVGTYEDIEPLRALVGDLVDDASARGP